MINPLPVINKKLFSQNENSYRPLALAIALALSCTSPNISSAATYTVMNTDDSGAGSLRQAILDANLSAESDTILFDSALSGSTINLTSGELYIDVDIYDLTITGPVEGDLSSITIDAGGSSRVISANDDDEFNAFIFSTITLENMTITGGSPVFDPKETSRGGGGVYSEADLILTNMFISQNNTSLNFQPGGGVHAKESLQINNSIITKNSTIGNDSPGGGILGRAFINNSSITDNFTMGERSDGGGLNGASKVNNSTISNNSTSGYNSKGGGLFNSFALALNNSTISNNTTSGEFSHGGGIYAYMSPTNLVQEDITLNQSTISSNNINGVNARGGGLFLSINKEFIINQSTITNNTSSNGAGGLERSSYYDNAYKIILSNTILSKNTGPEGNFATLQNFPVLESNHSLFGDNVSEINGTNTDTIISNTPDLGPLKDNGGPTFTHLPNLTSPAFNTGSNSDAPSTIDQRGDAYTRFVNDIVDIGAVEISISSKPIEVLKRSEIVKPILKGVMGSLFIPNPSTGAAYDDVAVANFNANWIEKFKADGYTEGCAIDRFCPEDVVTKEQLAKMILKAKEGISFVPMPATGIYTDVPIGSFNADWIEALNLGSMTTGCATGKFCPNDVVTIEIFENILNAAFP